VQSTLHRCNQANLTTAANCSLPSRGSPDQSSVWRTLFLSTTRTPLTLDTGRHQRQLVASNTEERTYRNWSYMSTYCIQLCYTILHRIILELMFPLSSRQHHSFSCQSEGMGFQKFGKISVGAVLQPALNKNFCMGLRSWSAIPARQIWPALLGVIL